MTREQATDDDRLQYARLLVELGDLPEAEREVATVLDEAPTDLTALNLFAKIKHIQGELSQAIACWAQIHALSPHSERALMCLGSILHLAKDPERNAGEFLALGQFQLARKPASHIELEAVFRMFLARRPDEARALCDRLVTKYKSKDGEIYKLAVLAKAWIAELSGDLDGARVVLEGLGLERGFETDIDRVQGLARVYEALGTPEHLEKAVRIFEHLEQRFGKISAQSRMAVLYRKLGRDDLAQRCDRSHLESFQRRMHRLSLPEVVAVAARRYIPLERLRTLRPAASSAEAGRSPRERAILAAVQREHAPAQQLFRRGGELLDRKYLAELEVLEGRAEDGARLFLETLFADPDDTRVISWLLAHYASTGCEPVAAAFRRPELRAHTLQLLDAAVRATPLRAAVWREMAAFYQLQDELDEAAQCAERAADLEQAAQRDARPIGRVLAAAVYHFIGKAKGLIHQIWVHRRPVAPGRGGFLHADDILGNITPEMKQGIRNTFFAVREYARSQFPRRTADILDYDYTYKVTKEDEPSGGLSAGLPTALAFLSVFLQRPVPQDMAFSGVVIADSHDVLVVRHVGEAEYKVKAAYNRNLRMLVLPRDNRPDLVASAQVPPAISEEIVRYVTDLDEAAALTFGDDLWRI